MQCVVIRGNGFDGSPAVQAFSGDVILVEDQGVRERETSPWTGDIIIPLAVVEKGGGDIR